MHFDEFPADGKAQARATVLARDRGVGLLELGEHGLELVRRNADLSGVRSSWLMLARKSDLCRLAASSCLPFSSISRNSRAF